MFCKFSLYLTFVFSLPLTILAQKKETAVPIQIRAVLHDPVKPTAELFYTDKSGAILPLNFRPQDLSRPISVLLTNGSLVLYDKANVDPEKPEASLAASIKLPASIKKAIILVMPSPAGEKPAYRMLVIDDSTKAFPPGESRIVPLVGVETAVQAGEHRLPISPGKITAVPPVKKVNEYNMAQTNFYYKQDEAWVPFTERQLQFLDVCRRIFIIHVTPGAAQPVVSTIVDVSVPASP